MRSVTARHGASSALFAPRRAARRALFDMPPRWRHYSHELFAQMMHVYFEEVSQCYACAARREVISGNSAATRDILFFLASVIFTAVDWRAAGRQARRQKGSVLERRHAPLCCRTSAEFC